MSRLLSHLVSKATDLHHSGGISQHTPAFTLTKSDYDPTSTIVKPAGYPPDAPPLYIITSNELTTPNLLLTRGHGPPGPHNTIGHASISNSLSSADLFIHGRNIHMRMSQMSGSLKFEAPPLGELKWKRSELTNNPNQLIDANGYVLANLKSSSISGTAKGLQMLIPGDEFLVELVLLSGMAAKMVVMLQEKVAGEVASAVAGA